MRKRNLFLAGFLIGVAGLALMPAPPVDIQPIVRSDQVSDDPDDPAIWVHPTDSARSLIIGTNKVKAPRGALVVFGLDGRIRQTVTGLDRPNNVDIEYGLKVGGQTIDIAVATERLRNQLRIFRIAPDGSGIGDVTSPANTRVFAERSGEQAAPMGISLYRRARDGAVFAIVAPRSGPRQAYLGQYRLDDDGQGRVKASFVRYFGNFSGRDEIEAVAVDDALGYVYYADEGNGIHKYYADPDHSAAATELAHFGENGFGANREGIAIYERKDGTGYIVCTDQINGNSEYHVYRREGEPGRPHDHSQVLKVVRGGADSTDGVEITSRPLGPKFPAGILVAMNSRGRNFLFYRWEDIASTGRNKLVVGR
ncbi:MAG TPA: phytase [Bryobacteraceae bacterium]|nr:phytase [Bryobacteraceae bacterium]